MSNYQEKNRVKFVEPTEINNIGRNGYQSPLEDLCISVDLEIIYSTRKACGIGNENGEMKTVEFSSDNGTIAFNGGTNGFLTTNFTDITASKPWENTRECLGIKSIDITYNPTMYPQVIVKFTDIRGASLINSQELKSNYFAEYRTLKQETELLDSFGFSTRVEDILPEKFNRFENTKFHCIVAEK